MASVERPGSGPDKIRELERRIKALENAAPLKNSSITGGQGLRVSGGGSLRIEDGGNVQVAGGGSVVLRDGGDLYVLFPDSEESAVYAGDIYATADGAYQGTGLLVQQPDGDDILTARTDKATNGVKVIVRGTNDTLLFSTSPARGGLDYPIIPFPFHPYRPTRWESTTSGTFEPLYRGFPRKASDRVSVSVSGVCDGGTTGEARVMLDGTQVGSTLTIPSGGGVSQVVFSIPDPLDWSTATVTIEGRRTAGTGSVYVNVDSASSWPA